MNLPDLNNIYSAHRVGTSIATNSVERRRAYQRDYDRIIFSSAFRSLQDKTQVFPLPVGVLVHNRLTHSLEVSSVGRSLGAAIGTKICERFSNELSGESKEFYLYDLYNVLSSACLCHDIGNPAFGHAGEDAISAFFRKNEQLRPFFSEAGWQDLLHFEGNANALRIVTKGYNENQNGGLQLTYSTLCAIAKYPCESIGRDKRNIHRKKFGFFQPEKEMFMAIAEKCSMVKSSDNPLAFQRHPFVWLVEAADDICYNMMDLEDAYRLGIIEHGVCVDLLKKLVENLSVDDINRINQRLSVVEDKSQQIAYLRSKAIGALIARTVEIYMEHLGEFINGTFTKSIFDIMADSTPQLSQIVEFSVENVYNHIRVVEIENAGYNVMYELLSHLIPSVILPKNQREVFDKKVIRLLPAAFFNEKFSEAERIWGVVDYVSGMTDNFATALYRKIKGIDIGFTY
ncbi:MAG: dNTP triphosphohydrolase [Bacteroidales bacterium]|nr:dNTP triphosphohydrolase [Bacteroidales bacterium]